MRTHLLTLPVLLAVAIGCRSSTSTGDAAGPGPVTTSPPHDRMLIHGTWKIVDSSRTGEARQRDLESTVRFEGDSMTFLKKDGTPGDQCSYSLGMGTSPKQLDLVQLDKDGKPKAKKRMPKGPEVDAVTPGIYELNGDELKLAITWTTDLHKRPKSFDAEEGSEAVRYRLERVK
jgi:uncharacterized protein (TIGR03067 family)